MSLGSIMIDDKPVFRMCEYFAKPKNWTTISIHQDNFYWNLKMEKP